MKRSEILFGILRVPLDLMAAFGALVIAYRLREANIDLLPNMQLLNPSTTLPPYDYYLTNFVLPGTIAFVVLAALLHLYSLKITLGPWREMRTVVAAALLWVTLIMAWFFLVEQELFFSRILLVQATVFVMFFALLFRTFVILIQRRMLRRGIGVRSVLSCGLPGLPESVRHEVSRDIRFRYLGHVATERELVAKHENEPIDLVMHTDPSPAGAAELIDYCRSHHIGYAFVPGIFADVPHQLSVHHLGLMPVLQFEPTPLDGWGRVWKRLLDLIVGGILLICMSPILIIVALLILITCGWPIFYVSKRVGQYGKSTIPLLKFRTMCVDADNRKESLRHMSHRQDGPLFKIKNDPRITPIGRVLRRFSIDELPQLLNVVLGHLSIVGPRPHLPEEVARYREKDRRVFAVRPGVTGLSQVSGRSNLSFEEEVKLDMRYVEDWSLAMDAWVLWRTFFVVLFGKGAD